jgi:hypothetical protein
VLWLVGVAATFLSAPAALYAQPPANVKVFFYPNPVPPKKIDEGLTTLLLRPNVEQESFLFVHNFGDEIKIPVTVELRAGGKPVASAKLPGLAKEATQLVSFAPPAPAPPGSKPPPPAELKGSVEVVAYTDKEKQLGTKAEVSVGTPANFVDVATPQFDIETRTLTLEVKATKDFSGPPSRVELDLRPSRIPFLVPQQKREGSYSVLLQAGQSTLLEAQKLDLKTSEDSGLVYVKVDGYERAFTFQFTNAEEGKAAQLKRLNDPILRLLADRVAASGGPSNVGLEADNLPEGSKIELGLYRDNSFKPEKRDGKLLVYEGSRRTQVFFSPQGPEGGLAFRTQVADWTTDIETTKVFGNRILLLQLAREGKHVDFTGALNNGPLSTELVDQVTAGLLIDGTPPEAVKFVDFPKEQVRGTLLTLKATGRDPESGIRKVVFFVGKLAEGKIPPAAVQAEGEKVKDKDLWVADLPVATDKPGILEVGVQFTNGVGLTETVGPIVIKLVDAKPAGATIKGEVVEGERAQAGLEVILRDPQGVVKDKVKTDAAGKFVFKDVPAGQYQIVVVKTGSMTKGQAVVTVAAGDEKVLADPIKLTR